MTPSRADSPTGISLSPTSLQILLGLVHGPRHGYGIKLDVEERTDGAVSLGSGTLYQALHRLEEQGLIESVEAPDDSGDGRRGRHYVLRDAGREALERELALMRRTVGSAAARDVLAGTEREA